MYKFGGKSAIHAIEPYLLLKLWENNLIICFPTCYIPYKLVHLQYFCLYIFHIKMIFFILMYLNFMISYI